jgi:hypothetical protein
MSAARSRFSPLHVAALATFLVPLAILAALGWSELRQSGAAAEAALTREGEQFLLRARQATAQRLEQLIPAAFESTRAHLETEGPVRTALRLSEQEDFAALRSIVLLDEQGGVVWPPLPLTSVYLPLAREPQRQSEAPVADLVAINAFDFFLDPETEAFPFPYDPVLTSELAPYLVVPESGPLVEALLADFRRAWATPRVRTIDMLVALNGAVRERVSYGIRMEPGIQTPDKTLEVGQGSCRDTGWLLVQILRHLGLAARFVSGYLIQLSADPAQL